jgi:hypothetical protein
MVSNVVREWYSKRLQAVSLDGPVLLNLRAQEADAGATAGLRAEVAVIDDDYTDVVIWGRGGPTAELATSEGAHQFWVMGDTLSIADGQRIRLRVYAAHAMADDAGGGQGGAHALTLYYAGTSGGASGDSYATFPVSLAEYTPPGGDEAFPFVGGGYYPT